MSKAARNKKTVDDAEVEKFSKIADEWWNPKGNFRPLHLLNPLRIGYVKEKAAEFFGFDNESLKPLKGLKILDIGCGGGLLSIPMSRLGAEVTGVDASSRNIEIAKAAAKKQNVKLDFKATTVEELAEGKQKFDIILNMEVAEHVADVKLFLESCANLLKPKGMMFVATINRTPKSYLFAIVGAEYILRILPKGTHSWKKFLKPSEINKILGKSLELKDVIGVSFNPANESFKLVKDTNVNYMMCYERS